MFSGIEEEVSSVPSGLNNEGVLLVVVGRSYSYRILAEDEDGDEVTVTLVGSLPGATISQGRGPSDCCKICQSFEEGEMREGPQPTDRQIPEKTNA